MRCTLPLRRVVVGTVLGALTLSGCSVYDAPLPGGPDTGEDPMTVSARFRDVLDLVPNSTVKLDDVNVGKITGIELDGYVAEVEMELRDDVELPDNVNAQIRQTSLLGEKFISLERPQEASSAALSDGDMIGLDRTGRNPEIEEVFSALALLLNGGGVGQLRSIAQELNLAFDGRTEEIRSVLNQIELFVGQLDENKAAIVAAIENTNRLAERARAQERTIENALDDVPAALRSLNGQRRDLVRMLEALTRLSDVGVDVIRRSKESTINSLRDLGPVLEGLADAGQNLPRALQVYLTYPFVDEAVGRDPQVARNLHMGDYTNLSVELDLDLAELPLQEIICGELDLLLGQAGTAVDEALAEDALSPALDQLSRLLGGGDAFTDAREQLREQVLEELTDRISDTCEAVPGDEIQELVGELLAQLLVQEELPVARIVDLLDGVVSGLTRNSPILRGGDLLGSGSGSGNGNGNGNGSGNGGNGGGGLGNLLGGGRDRGGNDGGAGGSGGGGGGGNGGGLLGGVFGRTAPGYDGDAAQIDPFGIAAYGLDPGVGTLLLQGVATQR